MERHTVLELMVRLKLRGMRAVYDEVITQASKRDYAPERIVGELLAAQLADVESRATAYRMGNAKFPVLKTLAEFDLLGGSARSRKRATSSSPACNTMSFRRAS